MPDLEGIGDAATGAVLARAVEPRTGASADGHTQEKNCLNCAAELRGEFCHACGQRAHVHRTLVAFWHDLAHGVLHLDGKIWRTLPLLAWHPGELTRRYVDGERARFVSPMALFLFSVFLMFAVFSLIGAAVVNDSGSIRTSVVTDSGRAGAQLNTATEAARAELKALQDRRGRIVAAGQPTADIDGEIREKQNEIAIEERIVRGFIPEQDAVATINATRSDGGLAISTGAKSVDDWFIHAYQKAKENPKLLIYKLQSNAYKFSWLLIPISIPLVWLLFLNRRRYRHEFTAYDHTVFVTYSIAFMSLAAIALSLFSWMGLPAGIVSLSVIIIPPLHIYRQLKGTYGLSRGSALWRTAALLALSFVALMLFVLILLTLGAFG